MMGCRKRKTPEASFSEDPSPGAPVGIDRLIHRNVFGVQSGANGGRGYFPAVAGTADSVFHRPGDLCEPDDETSGVATPIRIMPSPLFGVLRNM